MKLKKSISLPTAFSIAAGAMISSGLFVLPGIVYAQTGPSIILAYLVAGLLMLPTMFVQSELATAMPKAGGAYVYIMRILGPQTGMIAGFANWFSIAMKSAFALVGIGTFLTLIIPETSEFQIRLIAAGAAVFFTVINLLSTKHSGKLQTILVFLLLSILAIFIIRGYPEVNFSFYKNFFSNGRDAFFAAVGMVFISFGGLTKIASMSEEIKNSGKNLPRAMFLAFFVMMLFYLLVISIVVGILPHNDLIGNLTPVTTAAKSFAGNIGVLFTAFAAFLAYVTTANAGIMAASRTPLAMGRDGLIPETFTKLSKKHKTPYVAILITGVFIVVAILGLRITALVKVASSLMLFLFILDNLSLLIIRNIHLRNYKPTFKAPLFPYVQIIAIIFYMLLINEMGHKIMFMTLFFILLSLGSYFFYARKKDFSQSALIILAKNILNKQISTDEAHKNIEEELFELLQNREDIIEDFFDKTVKSGIAFDFKEKIEKQEFLEKVSDGLANRLDLSSDKILKELIKREKSSSTNITSGLAIPHIIIPGKGLFEIALARLQQGIRWEKNNKPVRAVFLLIGTLDMREHHLKALMAVAQLI
ncbi:MAG: amino acid permease, partial [Candidatus Cloacimonadota bacterium]|nr:amino acid permease [Candidatus Cloacimonadota bacterium]